MSGEAIPFEDTWGREELVQRMGWLDHCAAACYAEASDYYERGDIEMARDMRAEAEELSVYANAVEEELEYGCDPDTIDFTH